MTATLLYTLSLAAVYILRKTTAPAPRRELQPAGEA